MLADTKYGFRYYDGIGQITLLRNAYFPDPYSDRGIHNIRVKVASCDQNNIPSILSSINHPLPYVSGRCHKGTLGTSESFAEISDNVRVSAIKGAEDGCGVIVRVYEAQGEDASVALGLYLPISKAYITDTNENIISEINVKDGKVNLTVPAYSVVTIKAIF